MPGPFAAVQAACACGLTSVLKGRKETLKKPRASHACAQVGVDQVVAVQNAMAQVQRPCGDGRVQPKKRKKSAGSDGGSDGSSGVDSSGRRRRHQRLLKEDSVRACMHVHALPCCNSIRFHESVSVMYQIGLRLR